MVPRVGQTRESLRKGQAGPLRTLNPYSYDPLRRLDCTTVRMAEAAEASWLASFNRRIGIVLAFFFMAFGQEVAAISQSVSSPSEIVRIILAAPDNQLDYGRAKLAFDRVIEPSLDAEAAVAEVERLAARATALAGPRASDGEKLAALRRVIYVSGGWNGNRPFSYDQADPLGRNVRNKLISTYLATRRGNCVSMPLLFLLVGERMGLNLSLATAPLHVFVRYIDPLGREMNLEATSGGHPARTIWYREQMPMADRAVESGLYLRTLTRREVVALMATIVVEFLISERRFQEAIEVGETILQHAPRDALTMVQVGTAYGQLMNTEFVELYPIPALIPPALRMRYAMLAQRNQQMFQTAEALGWEPPHEPQTMSNQTRLPRARPGLPYRSTQAAIASSLRMRSFKSATSIMSPAGLRGSRAGPASSIFLTSSQPCQPRRAAKVAMPRPERAAPATVIVVIGSFISSSLDG
jgi:regulator of sirC expression with transglutaminase-like and TPR domain